MKRLLCLLKKNPAPVFAASLLSFYIFCLRPGVSVHAFLYGAVFFLASSCFLVFIWYAVFLRLPRRQLNFNHEKIRNHLFFSLWPLLLLPALKPLFDFLKVPFFITALAVIIYALLIFSRYMRKTTGLSRSRIAFYYLLSFFAVFFTAPAALIMLISLLAP